MSSPGGRIEIRIDPDLTGFASRAATGLEGAGRTAASAFAESVKRTLLAAGVGLGVAVAAFGKSTLDLGIDYQNQLNTLQAVSGATAQQMEAVSATAKQLGADLTLPAASAADAAAVMTELAKANFSVDEAQQAALGSLQLAAAAQIDGARAAEIQANAINAFGLSATDATRVADVLANAANASSAEITDIADALAQASAVAASANISIEDTATVLGILANNGIKGSDAGTLLKSALLALQSPSNQARAAMTQLGLSAYDSQGNFVGLRSIFEQLQTAQAGMTQEAYEAATSTLFGSDAARLAGIAAREGGAGFDEMSTAIGRQGAAADVAAAKSKGLGGAIAAFQSQLETVQIDIFERAAPGLEKLVRAAAAGLPGFADSVLSDVDTAVGYVQQVGPRVVTQLDRAADLVERAWGSVARPIVDGVRDISDDVVGIVADVASSLEDLAGKAVDKVAPLADAVGDLVGSLDDAGGPLDTVGGLLSKGADAAGELLDAAGPLIDLVSGLVHGFAELPGPLQTSIIALAGLKLATSGFRGGNSIVEDVVGASGSGSSSGLATRLTAPFQQFAGNVRLQMALADDSITSSQAFRGGLATAFEQQAPRVSGAFAQISGAYRGGVAEAAVATEKYGLAADTFAQKVGGLGRAAQTAGTVGIGGLKSAGAGLVGFLGGPWGVGIAAAGIAVGGLTSIMQQSAQQAQNWGQAIAQGGAAAQQAVQEASNPDFLDRVGFNLTHPFGGEDSVGERQMAAATAAAREYRDSLSPLAQAQLDVQRETNDLSLAIQQYGQGSPEAVRAAGNFAYAQNEVAEAQRGVATATQTATDAITASLQQILGASNATIALSNAQIEARNAETTYQQVMADSTSTDDQRTAALNSLISAYTSQIALAGQKAAADASGATQAVQNALSTAAQVQELDNLIAAGGPATSQLQALRSGMDVSSAGAVIAQAALEGVTGAVTAIPGEHAVQVDALTDSAVANLQALGFKVETLPDGTLKVTADTAAAESALGYLTQTRYMTIVANTVAGSTARNVAVADAARQIDRAQGGVVYGPGTATSDSIRANLSNGEYVIRTAMVNRYGVSWFDALNQGRINPAVLRPYSSAAAGRVANTTGRFAAGGYVEAAARANGAQAQVVMPGSTEVNGFVNHGTIEIVDLDGLMARQKSATRAAMASAGLR